jgi:hypothetical protein
VERRLDGTTAPSPGRAARPKSSSLAPARVSITLPGLRSRCTMPARWRGVERLRDLRSQAQDLGERQRALREASGRATRRRPARAPCSAARRRRRWRCRRRGSRRCAGG